MKEKKLFLGVDGGGTKTEALIATEEGEILGRCVSGPANPYFIAETLALHNLSSAIETALQGLESSRIEAAAICVPGIESKYPEGLLASALKIPSERMHLAGDDLSTFYGALGKTTGIVVAAGTGSFATGIDSTGKEVRLGGWGPLLGDEGSGYAIGRDALRAVIATEESYGKTTLLTGIIFDHYKVHHYLELRTLIYQSLNYQNEISSLVPLVLQAAQAKDAAAQEILEKAGQELALLAINVARKLHLSEGERTIAVTGGLLHLGDYLLHPFTSKIVEELSMSYAIKQPEFNPAVGALLVAYRSKKIAFSDALFGKLKASYSA